MQLRAHEHHRGRHPDCGAFFGPRVAAAMGWPEPLILPIGAVPFPVVSSVVGALVLVLIVNILTHKRKF
ncbi:MAG: hypothetical protein AMS25_11535 [Gemmatimonas sp. SM23_52]|nr:MAG: hypothetical protein AMS25_11535 [Gemmatimonas sp. SM23_52]